MRILFTSAPLAAHLDWGGFLGTAAALRARGHEVLWVSGAAVAGEIAAAGLAFAPVAETGFRWPPPPPLRPHDVISTADYDQRRRERSLDQWLEVDRVLHAIDALDRVATPFAPDLVVSEFFTVAAGVWAEQAGVPFVVAGWPAHAPGAPSPSIEEARSRLARLLQQSGVHGHNVTDQGAPALRSPLLHLTFWSDRWFQGAPLLPQTRHVGGHAIAAPAPDSSLPSPDDRPWVLITLGTNFNQDLRFFQMAAQAAVAMGCLPIVATGALTPGESILLADQLPSEAIRRKHVDFAAVLPWSYAAIHHGGAGTTHALVTYGVPQVIVPHAGDQARQALGIQRTGVGITMQPREVTPDRLRAALAALLPDRAPARAAAATLRAEFAALGGIPQAARLLEEAAISPGTASITLQKEQE